MVVGVSPKQEDITVNICRKNQKTALSGLLVYMPRSNRAAGARSPAGRAQIAMALGGKVW